MSNMTGKCESSNREILLTRHWLRHSENCVDTIPTSAHSTLVKLKHRQEYLQVCSLSMTYKWAPSSEFVSSSIPSWQILTAHAQTFRGVRDLAFCLKVPLDSLLLWASSEGSGETARMRRLAWTFAARIGYKYQIRLTRSKLNLNKENVQSQQWRNCKWKRSNKIKCSILTSAGNNTINKFSLAFWKLESLYSYHFI